MFQLVDIISRQADLYLSSLYHLQAGDLGFVSRKVCIIFCHCTFFIANKHVGSGGGTRGGDWENLFPPHFSPRSIL